MKKAVIILSVLALSINSYGQNWADSIFYSSIRPNEELKLNTLYTDTVEYRGDYEDLLMLIQKDAETTGAFFCDGICEIASDLNLNPGDIVEIQWKIDSFRNEVDKELLLFGEYVIEITKIKDGI
ncbi:MAG: hypothetical protein LBG92_06365 [Prevotellaceae bacterium]|jgi:hypothetical protein|nr:hypothetical protein [Prevotellaceae bacterium]